MDMYANGFKFPIIYIDYYLKLLTKCWLINNLSVLRNLQYYLF